MSIRLGTDFLAGTPDISGKVNTDMDNLSSTGESLISGIGMPSTVYEDLTYGGSSDFHTATANGYVSLSAATTSGAAIGIYVGDENCTTRQDIHNDVRMTSGVRNVSGSTGNIFCPVRKGQTFTITPFSGTYTITYFRFFYAEGEI